MSPTDTPETDGTPTEDARPEVSSLTYEQAREELVGIVATLERGERPLEESMELWERGEALADHCASWLDAAQQRITDRVEAREAAQTEDTGEAPAAGDAGHSEDDPEA